MTERCESMPNDELCAHPADRFCLKCGSQVCAACVALHCIHVRTPSGDAHAHCDGNHIVFVRCLQKY